MGSQILKAAIQFFGALLVQMLSVATAMMFSGAPVLALGFVAGILVWPLFELGKELRYAVHRLP